MNSIILPIELANRILNYLARQPYADVAGMIADMQRAANIPEPIADEKKTNGQEVRP
jgi:hypothetical protein